MQELKVILDKLTSRSIIILFIRIFWTTFAGPLAIWSEYRIIDIIRRIVTAHILSRVCVEWWLTITGVSKKAHVAGELVALVRRDIGPVAAMRNVLTVSKLPKTRSGKISRTTMASLANNAPFSVSGKLMAK